jgi:hypothetical protein
MSCHKENPRLVGCFDHGSSLLCSQSEGFLNQQGLPGPDRFETDLMTKRRRSDDDDGTDQRIGDQSTIVTVDGNRRERESFDTFLSSLSADGNEVCLRHVLQKMSHITTAMPAYTDQPDAKCG